MGDSPRPKATTLSPWVVFGPSSTTAPPGADPTLGDPNTYLPLVAVLLVALPMSPAAVTPRDGAQGLGRQRRAGVAQNGAISLILQHHLVPLPGEARQHRDPTGVTAAPLGTARCPLGQCHRGLAAGTMGNLGRGGAVGQAGSLVWPPPAFGSPGAVGFACLNPAPGSTPWCICQPSRQGEAPGAPALCRGVPCEEVVKGQGVQGIPSAWVKPHLP